jgi:hypothetical protein
VVVVVVLVVCLWSWHALYSHNFTVTHSNIISSKYLKIKTKKKINGKIKKNIIDPNPYIFAR